MALHSLYSIDESFPSAVRTSVHLNRVIQLVVAAIYLHIRCLASHQSFHVLADILSEGGIAMQFLGSSTAGKRIDSSLVVEVYRGTSWYSDGDDSVIPQA